MKIFDNAKWEQLSFDIEWTNGVGCPVGLFMLDGETVLAADSSPAARALEARGALRFATMRFDPDPAERTHPARPYAVLGTPAAAVALSGRAASN